jgi:hypothetical protein
LPAPAPVAEPVASPVAPPPPLAEGRASLNMTLQVDAIEMSADRARISFAVMLTNVGDQRATGGLVRIALQQANSNQSALLNRFFDGAGGSVLAEDVEILPGAVGAIQRNALLPLDQIEPLLVGGYPALIPVIGLDVTYHWDGEGDAFGQVAGAYVLGSAGASDGRVAPIRLDQGARLLPTPAARVTEMVRVV